MPARLSAAATLTLAGNPFTASRAVPLNTISGAVSPLDLDLVGDEMRRAGEARRRLARHHPDRPDLALRRRDDRIEADQRAGRHDDAAAVPDRQVLELRLRQQLADAGDHQGAARRATPARRRRGTPPPAGIRRRCRRARPAAPGSRPAADGGSRRSPPSPVPCCATRPRPGAGPGCRRRAFSPAPARSRRSRRSRRSARGKTRTQRRRVHPPPQHPSSSP